MGAVVLRIDELRLVDDPVDFLVLRHELEERLPPAPFGFEIAAALLQPWPDHAAHLLGQVADEGTEHFILAVEIGVESAERDAGALRDLRDPGLVKSALAKLGGRRIQDSAQRSPPPFGARRLVAHCCGVATLACLFHPVPTTKLKPGSGFSIAQPTTGTSRMDGAHAWEGI